MSRAAIVVGALAIVGCGPKSPPHRDEGVPWASAGIDWSRPPVVKPTPLATPAIEQSTLKNGMHVFVVANPRLPIVTATAYVTRAGGRDDGATPGVAALTAQVLDELAHQGDLNGVDILESAGLRLDTAVATDHASFQITGGDAALAIDALGRVLQKPVIADAIVARVRDRHVGELGERKRRDRTIAAQVFDRVLFGEHPYGRPAEGTDADALKLTASDVIRFWTDAYGPDATTIVLAGDVSKHDLETLEATFAGWTKRTAPRPKLAEVKAYARTLAVVDRPGAEQAVVLVGGPGQTTGAPDRLAADLANAVLGGGAGSRLDRKLHDELGVTLGAGSSFWRGEWAGTWAVATTFRNERAAEGLRATLDVIESARTTPMTEDELAHARTGLVRALAQQLETVAGTARAAERVAIQPLPLTYYDTYEARLAAITPAAAQAAVQTAWAEPSIVIVGNWTRLAPELASLGLPAVKLAADGTAP